MGRELDLIFIKYFPELKNIRDYVCGRHNETELTDESNVKYRKDSHQKHLTNGQVNDIVSKILPDELEEHASSFDAMYSHLMNKGINRIGHCNCYDFCIRYLWDRGLKPDDYVYIHRGSLVGAKALRCLGLLHFNNEVDFKIEKASFPAVLRELESWQIENFLCSYDNELVDLAVKYLKNFDKLKI